MILTIIFWLLIILAVLGSFSNEPRYVRASTGVLLVLIGILGWKVLGNPFTQ